MPATYIKRADRRHYHVEIFDGRAAATVHIRDGYDRAVSRVYHVAPVRTRAEAIAAAIEDGCERIAGAV